MPDIAEDVEEKRNIGQKTSSVKASEMIKWIFRTRHCLNFIP